MPKPNVFRLQSAAEGCAWGPPTEHGPGLASWPPGLRPLASWLRHNPQVSRLRVINDDGSVSILTREGERVHEDD